MFNFINYSFSIPSINSNAKLRIGADLPNLCGVDSYIDIANLTLSDSLGNTPYYILSTTNMNVTMNHKLYAKWTPNTYTVTFDYDGATGGNSTQSKTVTYDETYGSLPEPIKTGYTFVGWNGKNLLNTIENSYTFDANSYVSQEVSDKVYLNSGVRYYISYNINNSSSSNVRNTPFLQYEDYSTRYYQAAYSN